MEATQQQIEQAQAQVALLWADVEAEGATEQGRAALDGDTQRIATVAPRLYAAIQLHGDATGWLVAAKSGRPLRHTFEQAIANRKSA